MGKLWENPAQARKSWAVISLGKGEVVGSIPTGSTIFFNSLGFNIKDDESPIPTEYRRYIVFGEIWSPGARHRPGTPVWTKSPGRAISAGRRFRGYNRSSRSGERRRSTIPTRSLTSNMMASGGSAILSGAAAALSHTTATS